MDAANMRKKIGFIAPFKITNKFFNLLPFKMSQIRKYILKHYRKQVEKYG